jgi:hypothetical protein
MMSMFRKWLTGLGTLAVAYAWALSPASADFVNGSFETGTTAGWTNVPPPGASTMVVTSYTTDFGPSATFTPTHGNFFARLNTDGPGSQNRISQGVFINAGEELAGDMFFDSGDPDGAFGFNDFGRAWISLNANGTGQVGPDLFYSDAKTVGAGHTPWTSFQRTITVSGTYFFNAAVANVGDSIFDSRIGIDNLQIVPEPGTLTLAGLGAIGLFGYARRRRQKQAV